jgi:hypothetical protein
MCTDHWHLSALSAAPRGQALDTRPVMLQLVPCEASRLAPPAAQVAVHHLTTNGYRCIPWVHECGIRWQRVTWQRVMRVHVEKESRAAFEMSVTPGIRTALPLLMQNCPLLLRALLL